MTCERHIRKREPGLPTRWNLDLALKALLFCKQLVANLTSEEWALDTYLQIDDERTYNDPAHYGADGNFNVKEVHGTAHNSVLAPNGDAVAITSTIND